MGSTLLLGGDRGFEHYVLDALHRGKASVCSARRQYRERERAPAFLCSACRDFAVVRDSADFHPFVAFAQGWRDVLVRFRRIGKTRMKDSPSARAEQLPSPSLSAGEKSLPYWELLFRETIAIE